MERDRNIAAFLVRFSRIIFYLIGIGVILPILIGIVAGIPAGVTFSFILSAFALQAAAPPVGVILGISVPLILVMLGCFAVGVVLGIQEICRTLGASSKRVAAFIQKVKKKTEKYPVIRKYGAVTCILIAWIPGIGLYGTPVIAWMLSWKRIPSVVFTAAGFLIASVFVLFFASRINEVLKFAGIAGLIISAIMLSLATGLSLTIPRLLDSVKEARFLLPLLAANFILVPLAAYLITAGFGLQANEAMGLMLIAAAAGAPFLFGFLDREGGTLARVAPLVAVLELVTIVYLPLVMPLIPPGYDIQPVISALYLVLLFLVPLGAAIYIRSRNEAVAVRWTPRLEKISWVAFAVVVITLLALFTTAFLQVPGSMVLLAAILLVVISFIIGYGAGGADSVVREAFAQSTTQRNSVAALIITVVVLADAEVMATVLITGLIALVPMLVWRRMKKKTSIPSL